MDARDVAVTIRPTAEAHAPPLTCTPLNRLPRRADEFVFSHVAAQQPIVAFSAHSASGAAIRLKDLESEATGKAPGFATYVPINP